MSHIYNIPSVLGGSDFFDDSGQFVGYSVPSAFGGEDFYGMDNSYGSSVDSTLGGQDIDISEEDD